MTRSPLQVRQLPAGEVVDETPEQQAARLQARVAQLEAENDQAHDRARDLSAAKYFAGETNW